MVRELSWNEKFLKAKKKEGWSDEIYLSCIIPAKYNHCPVEPVQKPTAPPIYAILKRGVTYPLFFGWKNRRAMIQPNPGDASPEWQELSTLTFTLQNAQNTGTSSKSQDKHHCRMFNWLEAIFASLETGRFILQFSVGVYPEGLSSATDFFPHTPWLSREF